MKAINVKKQGNRLYRVESLPPSGKGNLRIVRDVPKDQLDEVVEAERLYRQRLCDHLREVRRILIEECGRSPDSFTPIVE